MPSSENFDPGRLSAKSNEIYGIRISMQDGDTFAQLIGDDWNTTRWYATEQERDRVLATIGSRHVYSRIGDEPTLHYEAVNAPATDKPTIGQSS